MPLKLCGVARIPPGIEVHIHLPIGVYHRTIRAIQLVWALPVALLDITKSPIGEYIPDVLIGYGDPATVRHNPWDLYDHILLDMMCIVIALRHRMVLPGGGKRLVTRGDGRGIGIVGVGICVGIRHCKLPPSRENK